MPSRSRARWETERRRELDELERAQAAAASVERGRRLTRHINLAYTVMLSAQLQGFCRQLHSEATDYLIANLQPVTFRVIAKRQLVLGRKLDTGNPNPGNLGSDFSRFGLDLWPSLMALGGRYRVVQSKLEELNAWRNAIAHEALDPTRLGGRTTVVLATIRSWRSACNDLVRAMDRVLGAHLTSLVGSAPWQ